MRLGLTSFNIFINKIPYRFRGKNRIVRKPTMHDLLKMKVDFEREEKNMLLLRHPYLTVEQSNGHMQNANTKEKLLDKIFKERAEKFSKEIKFSDRLSHLRVTESWD